jgi:uncharacterized protein
MPPTNNITSRLSAFVPFLVKALIFFALLFAFTELVGPLPFSVRNVNNGTDVFSMSGEGKESIKPDVAVINLGVQANAATVKEAQDRINESINSITSEVKKLGIDEKDIKTENYNVYPNYDALPPTPISMDSKTTNAAEPAMAMAPAMEVRTLEAPAGGSAGAATVTQVGPVAPSRSTTPAQTTKDPRIKSYNANTNLSIKVRDLEKVNQVIDAATNLGANQIGGVTFDVDDRSKAEDAARKKAVDEAKKKAEMAAKTAGIRLGKVINYNESFNGGPYPYFRAESMMSKDAGDSTAGNTSIQPGSMEVVINVTLSYEIR